MRPVLRSARGVTLALLTSLATASLAPAFDLSAAYVETFPNGLTVILLEDHAFPVVSVQVLYRVGSRNETVGRTGVAHFLEHMAFRDTASFPGTEVVSRIYAAGGEWHGYTWLDETTYYATVPADQLDLLLRIEADRMARLEIKGGSIEAERGAVLAEMHGYQTDPASRLADAVHAACFEQHPYRYDVVGWESDIRAMKRADLVDFYQRYYGPDHAVLAVVGDFSRIPMLNRIRTLFASSAHGADEDVRTVEPAQLGVRRVEIPDAGSRRFQISYKAPGVTDPDYATMLVIQAMLAGTRGVNFLRAGEPVPAEPGSRLAGVADDVGVAFVPTRDPYVLSIVGVAPDGADPAGVEVGVEERIRLLRDTAAASAELDAARRAVRRALVFDVQTTEDAAHQLAFFEGLRARHVLLGLSDRVGRVTAAEVRQAAQRWLQPWQRNVGWTVPDTVAATPTPPRRVASRAPAPQPTPRLAGERDRKVQRPESLQLSSGLPVVLMRVQGMETAQLRLLVRGTGFDFDGRVERDSPVLGFTSLSQRFLRTEMWQAIEALRKQYDGARPRPPEPAPSDPLARTEWELRRAVGLAEPPGDVTPADAEAPAPAEQPVPALIVMVGDLDPGRARAALASSFGKLPRPEAPALPPLAVSSRAIQVKVPPGPQAALGYAVPAPPPASPDSLAWRALLYVFSHDYEGRFGKQAIGGRGLLYYVDSAYRHDGGRGLVSLTMGVDPDKLGTLRLLFFDELGRLTREPPTQAEVDEARHYLIGRRLSAAQSPAELTAALADEWMGLGRLESADEFAKRVNALTRDDVLRVLPDFVAGATITLDARP